MLQEANLSVQNMYKISRTPKATFVSHHNNQKIDNMATGVFHYYRMPDKPEPFSKESAIFSRRFAKLAISKTNDEANKWKDGAEAEKERRRYLYPHQTKLISPPPPRECPSKEYYERVLGKRPRSNSCTWYSENEMEFEAIRDHNPKRTRRHSTTRTKLNISSLTYEYFMTKFNIPDERLEAQHLLSYPRNFGGSTYEEKYTVLWKDYHYKKMDEAKKNNKNYELPPLIAYAKPTVTTYFPSADNNIPVPKHPKTVKPWQIDCAERLRNLFYPEKEKLVLSNTAAEVLENSRGGKRTVQQKLRSQMFESATYKNFFVRLLTKQKDTRFTHDKAVKLSTRRLLRHIYLDPAIIKREMSSSTPGKAPELSATEKKLFNDFEDQGDVDDETVWRRIFARKISKEICNQPVIFTNNLKIY